MHYLVNNQKLKTRRDAEQYAAAHCNNKYDIRFVAGPVLDFSVPDLSLREAVSRRCKTLREQYSYLQLFYSGGSDSQTILNGFVNNDIPLNELVMSRWSCDGNFNRFHNAEINITCNDFILSHVEYIKKHKVKITYCDFTHEIITKLYADEIYLTEVSSNVIYNPGTVPTLLYAFSWLSEHNNICQIVGWEKPTLRKSDRGFTITYVDKTFPLLPASFQHHNLDYFYMHDNLVAVTQARLALSVSKLLPQILLGEILSNDNIDYFRKIITYARDAENCNISNVNLFGKQFASTVAGKEDAFFSQMKLFLPKSWEILTDWCGSSDFRAIANFCKFAPNNNFSELPGLLSHEYEIR